MIESGFNIGSKLNNCSKNKRENSRIIQSPKDDPFQEPLNPGFEFAQIESSERIMVNRVSNKQEEQSSHFNNEFFKEHVSSKNSDKKDDFKKKNFNKDKLFMQKEY